MLELKNTTGPHDGEKIIYAGAPVTAAASAMILLHGRGGTGQSMRGLAQELYTDGMAFIIPGAADNTWYPYRFIEKRTINEPDLTSALSLIDAIVNALVRGGMFKDRIFFLGFSQGACLAADYAARYPDRFGGVFILSGGLIGQQLNAADYNGDLRQTPVFLGCSDRDFHIPEERVHESARIFDRLNAEVTKKIYPGMGHTIIRDELAIVRQVISNVNFSMISM